MDLGGELSSEAHDSAGGGSSASADGLTVMTWPDQPPPADPLQLTLTNSSGLPNPIQYNVVPLLGNKGLNGSDINNEAVHIDGVMVAANQSNFERLTTSDTVAYLSCDRPRSSSGNGSGSDGSGDTFINASRMLNTLIGNSIKAIILYSETKNGCLLDNIDTLQYKNILSMIDAGDAQQVLGYLNNGTDPTERVAIVGNASTSIMAAGKLPKGTGAATANSAVAMSILYSITGLITVLFLAIIATGAVRAHRYPERYGPRSGVAGQPRQSRAKGLARAVLETIPIVKFNNEQSAKPDPDLELDAATTDGRETIMTHRDAADSDHGADAPADANADASSAAADADHLHPEATPAIAGDRTANSLRNSKRSSNAGTASSSHHERDDGAAGGKGVNLGCSICTEDFKVGEDMRVLPCNHQYHPACIDPWLVNVSGTCPLCRLDLNAEADNAGEGPSETEGPTLPPPLPLEGIDRDAHPTAHRHRLSRLFDVNRLRQASAEEQIAALREMRRSETRPEAPGADVLRGADAQPDGGAGAGVGTTAGADARADSGAIEGVGASDGLGTSALEHTGDGEGDERSRRARLSMRLKDKFRIRTSTRSADHSREP